MPRGSIAPLLAALCLLSAPASAETVLTNLTAPTTNLWTGLGGGLNSKAFGFTIGSDPVLLERAILTLKFDFPHAKPVVSIWSDASGLPGEELLTLLTPGGLDGEDDYVFEAPAPFTLRPGTTYWLHVRSKAAGDPTFLWKASDPATLPTGIATPVDYLYNDLPSGFYNLLQIEGALVLGGSYCTAVPNSTGQPGLLEAFGSDVVQDDDLVLVARQLPPDRVGYTLASLTQGFVTNVPGSQGNLCLGGQIVRFQHDVLNSGPAGQIAQEVDLTALPVLPGQTWNFQVWFRDANPTKTSNFTEGRSISFL